METSCSTPATQRIRRLLLSSALRCLARVPGLPAGAAASVVVALRDESRTTDCRVPVLEVRKAVEELVIMSRDEQMSLWIGRLLSQVHAQQLLVLAIASGCGRSVLRCRGSGLGSQRSVLRYPVSTLEDDVAILAVRDVNGGLRDEVSYFEDTLGHLSCQRDWNEVANASPEHPFDAGTLGHAGLRRGTPVAPTCPRYPGAARTRRSPPRLGLAPVPARSRPGQSLQPHGIRSGPSGLRAVDLRSGQHGQAAGHSRAGSGQPHSVLPGPRPASGHFLRRGPGVRAHPQPEA